MDYWGKHRRKRLSTGYKLASAGAFGVTVLAGATAVAAAGIVDDAPAPRAPRLGSVELPTGSADLPGDPTRATTTSGAGAQAAPRPPTSGPGTATVTSPAGQDPAGVPGSDLRSTRTRTRAPSPSSSTTTRRPTPTPTRTTPSRTQPPSPTSPPTSSGSPTSPPTSSPAPTGSGPAPTGTPPGSSTQTAR